MDRMKINIIKLVSILGLATSLMAQQGEFTSLDKKRLYELPKSQFKAGVMVDSDYGFGVSGELGNIIDFKLGLAGVGADFHIWKIDFNDKSAFLRERPLELYVSAGLGYRWSDVTQDDGFIVRTPIGADWQFSKEGWSAYLEIGPTYNFSADSNNKRKSIGIMSGTGIRYNF